MFRLFFLVLGVSLTLSAETITFKRKGQVVKTFSVDEVKKLVPARPVAVLELHDNTKKTYLSLPMNDLLTAVYGKDWTKEQEILFTCRDGYQPTVPMVEFTQYPSYLAYATEGGSFVVDIKAQNEKNIDLSPFYLIWDNLTRPELQKKGMGNWPYQLIGADLVSFKDRFPNLAPPDGSNAQVVRGFLAFRNNCLACHSVNGDGAPKSVELNYPASVTEYMKEAWLEKWILSPTSIRFNSTMPALGGDAPKKVVKDIIAYLKVMAKHKVLPRPEKEE